MKKSITTLDLNLLLCLQLLMQERSVTKAAKRINVTPSAVSKSLAKLRAWFDDPLFVNSPLGLSPTPLMVSMEQNLAEWMQMSNLLLDKPHHQTPRGLKFELAAESPLMMIMLNALSKQIDLHSHFRCQRIVVKFVSRQSYYLIVPRAEDYLLCDRVWFFFLPGRLLHSARRHQLHCGNVLLPVYLYGFAGVSGVIWFPRQYSQPDYLLWKTQR